jgi:flagellar basal-body rod modification protein FlgD
MAIVRDVSLSKPGPIDTFTSIKPSKAPVPQQASSDPNAIQSDFLGLLVAQMQNQNPLEPMDNLQFTTQLAQFSALEQAANTNKILEQMQAALGSRSSIDPVSLIGKEVEAAKASIDVKNGQPVIANLRLPKDLASLEIVLLDQSGKEVARYPQGEQKAGQRSFQIVPVGPDGNPLSDGTYTTRFEAKDALGQPLTVEAGTRGVVRSVILNGKTPTVVVDSKEIPLSDITRVNLVS